MTFIEKTGRRTFAAIRPYLTLYFIIGMAISLLCLWVFAEIADEVVEQSTLVQIDQALADALYASAYPQRTNFFIFISLLGSQYVLLPLIAIVLLWYALKRRWRHLALLIIAVTGGMVLNFLLKEWFARPRPQFEIPLAVEQSFSFPSGHSMMSLVFYGMLAYLICIHLSNRYLRILVVFGAALLVLLIGISRMYLGVHYLTDVVGGFMAGAVWLGTCILVAESVRQHDQLTNIDLRTSNG